MSAPAHDTWPQVGDTYAHWSDLLLATQLAALRSGFTGIRKHWRPLKPGQLTIRCDIKKAAGRGGSCESALVRAAIKEPGTTKEVWVVDLVRIENLAKGQHGNHAGGIGISKGRKNVPTKKPKLSVGRVVRSWQAMHLLEASLRSVSRAQGRYINSYAGPPLKSESSDGPLKFSYFFACVLRNRCPFYICFSPHKQFEGEGWICRDACVQHTCVSSAPTISRRLHDFLSFWPQVELKGDCSLPTTRQRSSPALKVSVTNEQLGEWPVRSFASVQASQAKLLQRLESRRSSLSRTLASLASIRQILNTLEADRQQARSSNETEEVKSLSSRIVNKRKKEESKVEKVTKQTHKIEVLSAQIEQTYAGRPPLSKSNASSKQAPPPAPLDSTTLTSSNSPADTAQTDELQNRQGSLVKAIDSLFSIRRLILDLDHKVSTALALDNLEGVRNYEAEKLELEKRREDIQSKVTKKQRKVERQKEKMKAKQVIEKKVVRNTSNSPQVKQGRKVKKSKKEKKMQ